MALQRADSQTGFYFLKMDAASNYLARNGYAIDFNGELQKQYPARSK